MKSMKWVALAALCLACDDGDSGAADTGTQAADGMILGAGGAGGDPGMGGAGGEPPPGMGGAGGGPPPGMGGAGGMPPMGPQTCEDQSDCDAVCTGLGCSCEDTPMGLRCVPRCETTDDCPTGGQRALECSDRGLCVPEGGPPAGDGGMPPPRPDGDLPPPPNDGGMPPPPTGDGDLPPPPGDGGMPPPPMGDGGMAPAACETVGEPCMPCPPEAIGCTCTDTPRGRNCVPACEVDEDCPPGREGQDLVCNEGTCRPARMNPGM